LRRLWWFAAVVPVAVGFLAQGILSAQPGSADGYVVKRGEGQPLFGGQTLIKASPESGTQGTEMFWGALGPEFSTGLHVHHQADEFFYVVSGTGVAFVGGKDVPIEAGDVVFVPKGGDHLLRTASDASLEIVTLVDRPGLASEFRAHHVKSDGGKVPLTLEQLNEISERYGTTYKTLN